jgi:hypothetical protein
MAELSVEGGDLVLRLTGLEKAEGVHGDLRAPLSAVRGVEILDDAHAPVGIGAGIKIGTRQGSAYDEWIVGCADPEAVAAGLGLPAGT